MNYCTAGVGNLSSSKGHFDNIIRGLCKSIYLKIKSVLFGDAAFSEQCANTFATYTVLTCIAPLSTILIYGSVKQTDRFGDCGCFDGQDQKISNDVQLPL